MRRREFLKMAGAAAVTLPMTGCAMSKASTGGKKAPPNIILVITDDQGYGDLSCHGHPVLKTPHLDTLGADSLRLTNFQVSPTCAPTRSAIMTGRHEFKNGVTHTILERERMTLDAVTLPETLKKAGYTTGIFGKWHLGDEDAYQPDNRGFDEVFIHGGGGIGQSYPGSCADAPPNQKGGYFGPVIKHNGTFVKTEGFCTDVFFRQALGWINQQRQQKEPFFAYITTNAPHAPYHAPEKYKKKFLEQGVKDSFAGFYGMIENIDDNMGLLREKLDAWGLRENTLLIFMTDNGSAGWGGYNAGMKGFKGTPHEGGTHVPAFFHWKGQIAQGVDASQLTAHIDLFPTLAELAGAKLPTGGQVEGRSLVPILKDPQAEWADRYLFTHRGRWKKGDDPDKSKYKACAVRNTRFRLINNAELYDMQADPGQTVNVIEQHPEVVKQMRAAYNTWWAETLPLMVNETALYEGVPLSVYRNWQAHLKEAKSKDGTMTRNPAPFIKQYWQQEKTTGISDWTPPTI